jgi:hypothetical protein
MGLDSGEQSTSTIKGVLPDGAPARLWRSIRLKQNGPDCAYPAEMKGQRTAHDVTGSWLKKLKRTNCATMVPGVRMKRHDRSDYLECNRGDSDSSVLLPDRC